MTMPLPQNPVPRELMNSQLGNALINIVNWLAEMQRVSNAREQFYVLASDLITIPANGVSENNVIQQGQSDHVIITDISHSATSSLYKFNFRVSGSQRNYFSRPVRANSLFLGTLPFRLTRPIFVGAGSGLELDLDDDSGADNTVQLVFIGYRVPR